MPPWLYIESNRLAKMIPARMPVVPTAKELKAYSEKLHKLRDGVQKELEGNPAW